MHPSGCSACESNVEALNSMIPSWAAGKTSTASPSMWSTSGPRCRRRATFQIPNTRATGFTRTRPATADGRRLVRGTRRQEHPVSRSDRTRVKKRPQRHQQVPDRNPVQENRVTTTTHDVRRRPGGRLRLRCRCAFRCCWMLGLGLNRWRQRWLDCDRRDRRFRWHDGERRGGTTSTGGDGAIPAGPD